MAEVIYVRKPPLNMVVPRIQNIFEREGIPSDSDGVRQLCEACWGVSSRKEDKASGGVNEGDIRGILVVAEWVASKLRSSVSAKASAELRLTKRWIESNILSDLSQGGGASRSIGRGGPKEVIDRIFTHNAGFPLNILASSKSATSSKSSTYLTSASTTASLAESTKAQTNTLLRTLIESTSEDDRIISDLFATYPSLPFQDDTFLTKPNAGNEWLHFYDSLSSRVYGAQEWELGQYLSTPALGFHSLFAGTSRHSYAAQTGVAAGYGKDGDDATGTQKESSFSGSRAGFVAHETQKANTATFQQCHSHLSIPLARSFRSLDAMSTELLPYLLRCLSPDVKPVVVGGSERGVASVRRGSEKDMVRRAVEGMVAAGVTFERARMEFGDSAGGGVGGQGQGGWVYRMEPGLDALGVFETLERSAAGGDGKVRYAVRQVLEQEYKREVVKREQEARVRRMRGLDADAEIDDVSAAIPFTGGKGAKSEAKDEKMRPAKSAVKRDFFGRPIVAVDTAGNGVASVGDGESSKMSGPCSSKSGRDEGRVWVTYHEGYSNAVRKGITMKELMSGL